MRVCVLIVTSYVATDDPAFAIAAAVWSASFVIRLAQKSCSRLKYAGKKPRLEDTTAADA